MCHNKLLNTIYLICLILLISTSLSFNQNVGPLIKSTHGEVWPKPMLQHNYNEYLKLEPEHFHFNV